ncbi:MAG: HTTM domain-containing protein [Myxococcota bacterium]
MSTDGAPPPSTTPALRGRRRLRDRWRSFVLLYCDADLRTLGALRIVLGINLALHALRVGFDGRNYYSNQGVYPPDWQLFKPYTTHQFSVFLSLSSPAEVTAGFALSTLCFLLFAAGYRTRVFGALSFVLAFSLDARFPLLENGGYVLINLLTFWCLFLPVGHRFSIDAWQTRRELSTSPASVSLGVEAGPPHTHRSLASALLLFNFSAVYLFNVLNKYGSVWRAGDSVHHALHLDRLTTPFGAWFRGALPIELLRVLNHTVLVVEASLFFLVIWPNSRKHTRAIACFIIAGLHGAFGTMMAIGPFSWFMMTWAVCLVQPVHWEAMGRWFRRRGPLAVTVPAGPFGEGSRALLERLDRTSRLHVTVGPTWTAGRHEGRAAVWAALGATPAGFLLAPLVRALSLGAADALVAWALAQPDRAAAFFGLTSSPADGGRASPSGCANPTRPTKAPTSAASRSPVGRRVAYGRSAVREGVVVLYLGLFVSQAINDNKAVPKPLKHQVPTAVRTLIDYPRLFQGWGMFSANPVRTDGKLVIEAITIDGRHVDPLSPHRSLDFDLSDDFGSRLSQVHQDYGNRIRTDAHKVHRPPLRRFLLQWHKTTGRPEDRLVWFAVYWLSDDNPPPGQSEPTKTTRVCILGWRDPKYRSPPGGPALPPRCKVESAGE